MRCTAIGTMGTVVRDWRLAKRPARRRRTRGSRTSLATAEQEGHELHLPPRVPTSTPHLLGRIAVVVVPLVLLVVWVWWLGAERRAVRALPPAERGALFEQTMRGFADLCVPPRAGLEQHCRREASFLLNFPECDARCVAVTRPILLWRS
ncbi:hypothetical protein K2Z84_12880 [Candidatus Binatia bacterium]|jgi:hypothetical protein|nr:hypothetical protein [Candidatus Binatia bacterium]